MSTNDPELRIGVFVCHCGKNIAGFLDAPDVAEYAKTLPNVVFVQENLYTCADSGLKEIAEGIKHERLNRVVVAACTPKTHEPLFRSVCASCGLNPYFLEFVSIRDHCSWVHQSQWDKATQKAKELIRMGVARAALLEPLERIEVDVDRAALVIGAGISGLTAALSLGSRGFDVKLVEREKEPGGLLRHLNRLYPSHDLASDVLDGRIKAVKSHPKIELITSAEVTAVDGFIGNYTVDVTTKGAKRTYKVGTIIVATGADVLAPEGMYGYDGSRVITQLELEKLLRGGNCKADHVVMIQCVGARGKDRGYCSRICCTVAIKNAMLIKELNPEATVHILHRGIQTYDAEFEDYYLKARKREVLFHRYDPENPPSVGQKTVTVVDELLGEEIVMPADIVVLSTPQISHADAEELAKRLRVSTDEHGFFLEAHVKLRPVDFTADGMFLCGSCHWPAHVGESVSQALGAVARASIPLTAGKVRVEPVISVVDEEKCTGCGICEENCPYGAIRKDPQTRKATVTDVVCKGCGICASNCPERAIVINHYKDSQIMAQVAAAFEGG